MDRKGIIGIVACVLLLVWWMMDQTKVAKQRALEAEAAAAAATPEPAASPTVGATPVPMLAAATPTPPVEKIRAPKLEETSSPGGQARYLFTDRGGGIARVILLDHTGESGHHIELNTLGEIPIGAVSERPGQLASWEVRSEGARIFAERTLPSGVKVAKLFTLPQTKDETITLDVTFTNPTGAPITMPPYYVGVGSAAPLHTSDQAHYTTFDYSAGGSVKDIAIGWFDGSHIPLVNVQMRAPAEVYEQKPGNVEWAAVSNQYFSTVVTPVDAVGQAVWAKRPEVEQGDHKVKLIEAALEMPGFTLAPDEAKTQRFQIYADAKNYNRLHALGESQGKIMKFGMFKIVSIFLLGSMNTLYGWFGNYALAIFALTLCIKTCLWPLQNIATRSMKRMQALSPKMTALREKYKDDPTRMNQELMKLYKDNGVNPFGGCLPMLVQIPIFFGFYSMLGSAVELRNHGFLWVGDLSQPDTIAHLFGFPINILPILMAATMLWQMQLTPKSGDAMQQRVFMFMPLIFIVFCYNFASALALYWTTQNLFSIVQLYLTRDKLAVAPPTPEPPPGTKKKNRGGPR